MIFKCDPDTDTGHILTILFHEKQISSTIQVNQVKDVGKWEFADQVLH